MNKNIIIAAVIGIIALGFGLIFVAQNRTSTQNLPQASDLSQISPTAAPLSVTVNLAAQNNSGESGTAVLTSIAEGKTKVVLKLTGAPQDISQPSHIHLGSCATLGEVLFPLTSPVNGEAETLLDVDLQKDILNKLPLALNVHKSLPEISTYFSCGDISPASGQNLTNPATSPSASAQSSPMSSPSIDDRRRGADKPEN